VRACELSQVEMMMVLSGFLLGRRQRQLCGAKCLGDTPGGPVATAVKVARAVWTYALHRAVRLWPMLLACVALQVRRPHALAPSQRGCGIARAPPKRGRLCWPRPESNEGAAALARAQSQSLARSPRLTEGSSLPSSQHHDLTCLQRRRSIYRPPTSPGNA